MNEIAQPDSLHRLVKQAIDSGAASTLAEAEALFRGYRVMFSVGAAEANDTHHQTALLTGIALARRVFLGGVTVVGSLDVPLHSPLPLGGTLREAVQRAGATLPAPGAAGIPTIYIGGEPVAKRDQFAVRTVFDGWRGGVVPAHMSFPRAGGATVALTPMLAVALAVNEAFSHVEGRNPAAGRQPIGLSLWEPSRADWFVPDGEAPMLRYLPSDLWLIGLGHLGQAYLWGLSLLPYRQPNDVRLVLQDVDAITPSTESTSVLSDASMVGIKKTRAMAACAERRGFATALYERLFDTTCRRAEHDPPIALCGVDNALGRVAFDEADIPLVIEAGLGRGYRDFRTIRLHTLPASRPASEIWKVGESGEDLTDRPAYKKLLVDGDLDQCGVTLLAGKAVGAPFVGAVAATLVLAEALRFLHGGPLHQLLDVDLRSTAHRTVVPQNRNFDSFNPGYVLAKEPPGT